jgi:membrane protein involved in colicin uptake
VAAASTEAVTTAETTATEAATATATAEAVAATEAAEAGVAATEAAESSATGAAPAESSETVVGTINGRRLNSRRTDSGTWRDCRRSLGNRYGRHHRRLGGRHVQRHLGT